MISQKNIIEQSKLISEYTKECTNKECIFPEKTKCNKIIQAHSVQKSKILDNIAYNGNVMTFDPRMSYVTLDFQEIGIGKASTFFGFCNYHDTKIFSKIENKDYMETPEQNFLHSYRTCARQYIEQKFALCVHRKMIKDSIEKKDMQNFQIITHEINIDNDLINNLKEQLKIFHNELVTDPSKRDYHVLFTTLYKLPYSALIAVNSIVDLKYSFSKENVNSDENRSNRFAPLFLNVFPQNNITYILLSCFSSDRDTFRDLYSLFNSFKTEKLENFFSSTILNQCRNIFISPLKWLFLDKDVRKSIVSNLIKNMYESSLKNNRLSLKKTINLFKSLKDT